MNRAPLAAAFLLVIVGAAIYGVLERMAAALDWIAKACR